MNTLKKQKMHESTRIHGCFFLIYKNTHSVSSTSVSYSLYMGSGAPEAISDEGGL